MPGASTPRRDSRSVKELSMKRVTVLASAIVTALAAVAFIAAAPASATVLCPTSPKTEKGELVCSEPYGPGPVYLILKSGTTINFEGYGTLKEAEEAENKELSEEEELAAATFTCNEGTYAGSLAIAAVEISSVNFYKNSGKCDSNTFGNASVGYTALNLEYQSRFTYVETAVPQGDFEIDELTKTAKMAFELSLPGGKTCKYEALTKALGTVANGGGGNPTTIKFKGGLFSWVKGSLTCPAFILSTATYALKGAELSDLYIATR
jgi:hypothetical protein